jgi:ferredoxin
MTKKMLLSFKKEITSEPVVYRLVKDFNLVINIFRAKITAEETGYMVLEMSGSESDMERAIAFVRGLSVEINESEKGLRYNTVACTHCGNCITHCPTKALRRDLHTMKVDFDPALCIECLNCIPNCPFGAFTSVF